MTPPPLDDATIARIEEADLLDTIGRLDVASRTPEPAEYASRLAGRARDALRSLRADLARVTADRDRAIGQVEASDKERRDEARDRDALLSRATAAESAAENHRAHINELADQLSAALKSATTAERQRDAMRAALEAVLEVSRDRQAFVMQGPRAFAKAEQIAKRALDETGGGR